MGPALGPIRKGDFDDHSAVMSYLDTHVERSDLLGGEGTTDLHAGRIETGPCRA
jgi:hypothetical protein